MTTGIYINNADYVTFAEASRRLAPRGKLSDHIATRGRSIDYLGLNSWLPNPDPVLKAMGKDIEVYRALRSDAHTGGCIRRRKAAVKALEWRIERDKASARMAKLCEEVITRLDLDQLISEVLDAVLYGYAPLEVMWQPGDGGRAPLPSRIMGKPPEWFLFDADARLRFRQRGAAMEGQLLPERKFLLAQQEASYANPYGFADLSMCFWPVTFKRGGLKYWYKFAEKYGSPWAVGKQPRNSPQPESNKLLEQLEAMIEDAVAVIPDDSSVEFLQATNSSGNADAYRELLMFCRSEVAIALLGQNQSTEADSTHASAMAGLDVTYEIRDSDKRLVESVINSQLLRWIVDLHEGETAPAPRFELWEEEEVSKKQAERDEILVRSGVRFTRDYWMRTYEFQEADLAPEADIDAQNTPNAKTSDLSAFWQQGAVMPQAAQNSAHKALYKASQPQAAAAGAAAFAESVASLPADPLDAATLAASADWQPVMQPMLEPVLAALEAAAAQGQTAAQFLQALPDVLARMDGDALTERLDSLTLAAHAAGALGLSTDTQIDEAAA